MWMWENIKSSPSSILSWSSVKAKFITSMTSPNEMKYIYANTLTKGWINLHKSYKFGSGRKYGQLYCGLLNRVSIQSHHSESSILCKRFWSVKTETIIYILLWSSSSSFFGSGMIKWNLFLCMLQTRISIVSILEQFLFCPKLTLNCIYAPFNTFNINWKFLLFCVFVVFIQNLSSAHFNGVDFSLEDRSVLSNVVHLYPCVISNQTK